MLIQVIKKPKLNFIEEVLENKQETLLDKLYSIKDTDKDYSKKPVKYTIVLRKDGEELVFNYFTLTALRNCLKMTLREHNIDISVSMLYKNYIKKYSDVNPEYSIQPIINYNCNTNQFYISLIGNFKYHRQAGKVQEVCSNVIARYVDKYITGDYYLDNRTVELLL